jgi:hypothetical protein
MPRLDGFGAVHFMKPELITVEDCSCTGGSGGSGTQRTQLRVENGKAWALERSGPVAVEVLVQWGCSECTGGATGTASADEILRGAGADPGDTSDPAAGGPARPCPAACGGRVAWLALDAIGGIAYAPAVRGSSGGSGGRASRPSLARSPPSAERLLRLTTATGAGPDTLRAARFSLTPRADPRISRAAPASLYYLAAGPAALLPAGTGGSVLLGDVSARWLGCVLPPTRARAWPDWLSQCLLASSAAEAGSLPGSGSGSSVPLAAEFEEWAKREVQALGSMYLGPGESRQAPIRRAVSTPAAGASSRHGAGGSGGGGAGADETAPPPASRALSLVFSLKELARSTEFCTHKYLKKDQVIYPDECVELRGIPPQCNLRLYAVFADPCSICPQPFQPQARRVAHHRIRQRWRRGRGRPGRIAGRGRAALPRRAPRGGEKGGAFRVPGLPPAHHPHAGRLAPAGHGRQTGGSSRENGPCGQVSQVRGQRTGRRGCRRAGARGRAVPDVGRCGRGR